MKRYIKYTGIALAAAFSLAACSVKENADESALREIKFSSSVRTFDVKAGDTNFDESDAVGLWSNLPGVGTNTKLTWTGTSLTAANPLFWPANVDPGYHYDFSAYYPYQDGDVNINNGIIFSVNTDQRTAENYTASDFMTANAVASPIDDCVYLNFVHSLSKLLLKFDLRDDETITEVTMGNVYTDVQVFPGAGDCWCFGDPGTIRAGKVTLEDNSEAWALIVAPGNCQPVVDVTTASGKQYHLECDPYRYYYFSSGRRHLLTAILDNTTSSLDFEAEVTDWLDESMRFGKESDPGITHDGWYVDFNGKAYPMEKVGEHKYSLRFVEYKDSWGFNIVRNDNRSRFGGAVPDPGYRITEGEETVIPLAPDRDLWLDTRGLLPDLLFDEVTKVLTVTPIPHQWESLGTGKFLESVMADAKGYQHTEFAVEIYKDALYEDFLLRNPYANWPYVDDYGTVSPVDLVLHRNDSGYYWIERGSWTGLQGNTDGKVYVWSDVRENDTNRGNYAYYYPEDGMIRFENPLYLDYDGYSRMQNHFGVMTITLPGYERTALFTFLNNFFVERVTSDAEGTKARILFRTLLDTRSLKMGLFSGTLSANEVEALVPEVKASGTSVDFTPEILGDIQLPITQTGTYTLILYYAGASGADEGWDFRTFAAVLPDDAAPAAHLTVAASADSSYPECALDLHVEFDAPSDLRTMVIEKAVYDASGRTDDDIYDYVYDYGEWHDVGEIEAGAVSYHYDGLEPETTYLLLAAGNTLYGQSVWTKKEYTTPSAPAFTLLGKGHYTDGYLETGRVEVDIYKADGISRYRLMQPFAAYWANPENASKYMGYSADYIDFTVRENWVMYMPVITGYSYDGRVIQYLHPTEWDYGYTNNTVLQEGVLNISPILTNNYYWWSEYLYAVGEIFIEMPGYTYAPSNSSSAPAPPLRAASPLKQESAVSAFFRAQHEVHPFTRHMLKTGNATVNRLDSSMNSLSVEFEK